MELLSSDQIAARLAAEVGEGGDASALLPHRHKYVKPLTAAADHLVEALRMPEGMKLGLTELDTRTRGFRASDLVIFTGMAHSGKTQIVNTMIVNNPEKRVLFFSLDDPAAMILAKLTAMVTGVPAELLEQKVRDGDEGAVSLIKEVAATKLPNLLIVDDVLDIKGMKRAMREAEQEWGAFPDCTVVDYLEMIPGSLDGEGENVKKMANKLKKWAKTLPCPLVVLHQGTRTNAKPGKPITLLSMGHSGEQQATIVIGCRRKKDDPDLDEFESERWERTVTLHIVKNKRPGGRCTAKEGIDFTMVPETGMIEPFQLPKPPGPVVIHTRPKESGKLYEDDEPF